jgi:hypothetical protein
MDVGNSFTNSPKGLEYTAQTQPARLSSTHQHTSQTHLLTSPTRPAPRPTVVS